MNYQIKKHLRKGVFSTAIHEAENVGLAGFLKKTDKMTLSVSRAVGLLDLLGCPDFLNPIKDCDSQF